MDVISQMEMTGFQFGEAQERGRQMAAYQVATNPEAKKRVEAVYGETYCRNRYPEAYERKGKLNIFRKVFKGW